MTDIREKQVIALDVGGTSVKSAIVSSAGGVVGEPEVTPIRSAGDAETILITFADIIRHHLSEVDPSMLLGVAFGIPGPFDYAVGVSYIKGVGKYEGIYGVNVKAALQARLALGDLSVVFRNDAEAAVVGEARYGAGRPYRRLIGVTLGTGCGSSFLVDGAPVTSGAGVPPQGWLYPMPFRGARADDLFSRRGVEARLWTAGASVTNVKKAATIARCGDQTILRVWEAFGTELGEFLDPFTRDFRADIVLVLGRIAGAFDLFGPALAKALSVPALPGIAGASSPLLGAAEMLFCGYR